MLIEPLRERACEARRQMLDDEHGRTKRDRQPCVTSCAERGRPARRRANDDNVACGHAVGEAVRWTRRTLPGQSQGWRGALNASCTCAAYRLRQCIAQARQVGADGPGFATNSTAPASSARRVVSAPAVVIVLSMTIGVGAPA